MKGYNGIVSISIEKKEDVDRGGQEVALVYVKDNGTGIDADIFRDYLKNLRQSRLKEQG